MAQKNTYQGLQKKLRSLKTPSVDVWTNEYADRDYTVHLSTNELTCICPKTGLPDFATIQIDYKPDRTCLELKSFKYYLFSFRQVGIFHEHLANKILDDLIKACQPRWMKIEVVMNPRGGIDTRVCVEYTKPKKG